MSDDSVKDEKDPKAKTAKVKSAMKEALNITKKLGAGASELLKKLKKDKSPEAMIKTLDEHSAANEKRRADVSGRVERIYNEIASKKKAFASAPPAKKRILEAELKSLLSTYKAAERELNILLENERNLAQVKGRLSEILAYGMAGVSEIMIDDVIDNIEDKVDVAEAVSDAAGQLEKAGKRRDKESSSDDLWAELDGFGEPEEPAASDTLSLDDFEESSEPDEEKSKEPAAE